MQHEIQVYRLCIWSYSCISEKPLIMLKHALSSFPTPGLQEPPPVHSREWLSPRHSFLTWDFRHWIYIATVPDQMDIHLLSLLPPASSHSSNNFSGLLYVQVILIYAQCWKRLARSGVSERTTPQGTSRSGEGMAGRNLLHGFQGDVSQLSNGRP